MIIWRGWGWLVPALLLVAFVGTQAGVEAWQAGSWNSGEWAKELAAGIATVLVGIAAYLINFRFRKQVVIEETGEVIKAPKSSLFFIPMEFWAAIIPAAFLMFQANQAERAAELQARLDDPQVNDTYLVDFRDVYPRREHDFPFGAMKVVEVNDAYVVFLSSVYAYEKKYGASKALREGEFSTDEEFDDQPTYLTPQELAKLHEVGAIHRIKR